MLSIYFYKGYDTSIADDHYDYINAFIFNLFSLMFGFAIFIYIFNDWVAKF